MQRCLIRRFAVVLGGALLAQGAGSARAWAIDVLTLTPEATTKGAAAGGIFRGTVVAESPSKVELKLGSNTVSIPTAEVASIVYDGHPASLEQAQAKEAAGSLAEAIDLYKKAINDANGKPMIVEDATFSLARATAELAQGDPSRAADAIGQLEGFARKYKEGRHVGLALDSLARLQIAREEYAGAEATLGTLAKLPGGDDRSASLRIKLLSRQGQTAQAIGEIEKIIAANPDGSVRKRDAVLAKAEALATLKKFAEAEELVRAVIKAAPPEDSTTQAIAHNTLGACLRAAGKTKDALYAYLHTDLLFSKDKEEHAKALGQIAQLYRELKQPARADETIERLKQDYPRSAAARASD